MRPKSSARFRSIELSHDNRLLRREIDLLRQERDSLRTQHALHLKHCRGGDDCRNLTVRSIDRKKEYEQHRNSVDTLQQQLNVLNLQYEHKLADVRQTAELLDKELERVQAELAVIIERAHATDNLQEEICQLHAKVQRRDTVIAKYETHNRQIMQIMKMMRNRGMHASLPIAVVEDGPEGTSDRT